MPATKSKKNRKESKSPEPAVEQLSDVSDGSPVVSDDDGIDFDYDPALIADDVISNDGQSSDSDDADEAGEESEGENGAQESGTNGNGQASEIDPGEESDSSSDGEANPVGNIPMKWYEGYDHIGYNRSGEKIVAKNRPTALDLAADRSAWRKIYDEKNDELIELSHDELKAIAKMRAGRYPKQDSDTIDEVVAWSGPVIDHPLTSGTEPKRRFLPSRQEARLVVKLVRGMREGKIKRPSEKALRDDVSRRYEYDIWERHEPKTREEMTKSERARDIMRVPAPKPPLPNNRESYNPPEEYLFNEKEEKKWRRADPEDRSLSYKPTKHDSLRHVPNYDNFIKERFERCLDLYLAVRMFKDHKQVDPNTLIPDLPNPRDLRPFPTKIVDSFGPLQSRVRCIDAHSSGMWLLSGSEDGCVRLWDTATGYNRATWNFTEIIDHIDNIVSPVSAVGWCPKEGAYVFAATVGKTFVIVDASNAMGLDPNETVDAMRYMKEGEEPAKTAEAMKDAGIKWTARNMSTTNENGMTDEQNGDDSEQISTAAAASGTAGHETKGVNVAKEPEKPKDRAEKRSPMLFITHPRTLWSLCWHRKGDYVACIGRENNAGIVAIHRISQRETLLPFKKKTAMVQAVKFHPTRPFFLLATKHNVRIYNLALQEMVKILKPKMSWISSIDVHHSGDHVLVTSYDKKVCWFDLDMSTKPYKTIRNHDKGVRVAKFHPRLPLFADSSDDGSCHVFHGTVYDDLEKDALIVPLTKLEGCSKVVDTLGVLDVCWHPRLPWLFTAGADGSIHLLTDCSQN